MGLLKSAAEATALIVKVSSGTLSDWWGKRKPLALLGYTQGVSPLGKLSDRMAHRSLLAAPA